DRLGRENYETGYLLKQLAVAGVQVVEQKTGRAIALATPTDRLQVQVGNYAAEVERDQEGQRTHQALRLKAQAGHVTGGCVFGYLNEDVYPERRAPRKVRHEAGGGAVRGGWVFGYLNEDVYPERRAPRKVRHEAGEDLA